MIISPFLILLIIYPHMNMWNIFKQRQPTQGDKANEEDPELITKQLRAKFEQKFKALSQQIKQSQALFSVYSQVAPREQQLAGTFQQVIATLEGLVSIIQELGKEIGQMHEQLQQLKKARHMVANHHSIVSDLQESYGQQIRNIYADHQKALDAAKVEKEELQNIIQSLKLQKQEVRQQLVKCQDVCVSLEIEATQLKNQNAALKAEIEELSLKCSKFLQGNAQVKKVINFESMKLEYLFYYGRLKEGITQFLSITDFQELKRTSKFFRHSLQKQQSKFLVRNIRSHYQQKQSEQLKNLKHYEKVMELFPMQNIKLNAIKYLHFRIKPASYILPYLQEETEYSNPKTEIDQKQKQKKFNWRGLFASQKQKKEQSKFNLSQIKNQEQFKRVEAKVESTFKSILSIKLPEDLRYFSETMERQLSQLKENLGNNKGPKGSQTAWTAELHCLCRFMYLEVNQLYNLLQAIFGELVVKSRRLVAVQQAHDELKENQIILRNLIENLSHDKANLEKKAVLIQNEILKRNLEKDTLANSYEQISLETAQNKQKYQNLLVQYGQIKKNLEKHLEQRKLFDENMARIRKQLEGLQGSPPRSRKLSQGSVCSQEASIKQ